MLANFWSTVPSRYFLKNLNVIFSYLIILIFWHNFVVWQNPCLQARSELFGRTAFGAKTECFEFFFRFRSQLGEMCSDSFFSFFLKEWARRGGDTPMDAPRHGPPEMSFLRKRNQQVNSWVVVIYVIELDGKEMSFLRKRYQKVISWIIVIYVIELNWMPPGMGRQKCHFCEKEIKK